MSDALILAPCGSPESVFAAVRCGANAIYLGTKQFNARKNATNFSYDELKNVVDYCHKRNVAVHVAVNTIVSDDEISDFCDTLQKLCELNVDAFIIGDFGAMSIAKNCTKGVEIHASTQTSVQTSDGFQLLEQMGCSTVVLPRELSKNEISVVASETSAKLEAFVHGALCMCVSGRCYLSAMIGGRSGNRGLCAQPCRLKFSAENGFGFDLSLKDLSLVENANEMKEFGVSSFKIEGRMKRPEYVAAAVSALRSSLDGHFDARTQTTLESIFSRSGFTKGYFENKLGPSMFGTRTKDDVVSADKNLLSSLSKLYSKEIGTVAVDFRFVLRDGEKPQLFASANGKTVFAESEQIPDKAINRPIDENTIKEKLSKCGGTQFVPGKIEIELDTGLIIPFVVINELRRAVLEKLENEFAKCNEKSFSKNLPVFAEAKHFQKDKKFILRFDSENQIPDKLDNVFAVVLPIFEKFKNETIQKLNSQNIKIIAEIPRGIFGTSENIKKRLSELKSLGINDALCGTLDAIAIAKKLGMKIHGGFSLNVFNSYSASVFKNLGAETITLSSELKLSRAKKIKTDIATSIIAYGRLPLMLTRNCPIKNGKNCARCKRSSVLTDRLGMKFPVRCTNGCSEILNCKPIFLADKSDIDDFDFLTLYFTTEEKSEVETVLSAFRKRKKLEIDFTRGLAFRGVL